MEISCGYTKQSPYETSSAVQAFLSEAFLSDEARTPNCDTRLKTLERNLLMGMMTADIPRSATPGMSDSGLLPPGEEECTVNGQYRDGRKGNYTPPASQA